MLPLKEYSDMIQFDAIGPDCKRSEVDIQELIRDIRQPAVDPLQDDSIVRLTERSRTLRRSLRKIKRKHKG